MPPKKIKFNVKKKAPAKKAPAKKKKKLKFNVKPEEVPDPEQDGDDMDEYDNAQSEFKRKVAKYQEMSAKVDYPLNYPKEVGTFAQFQANKRKTEQKSYSTAEAKAEVATGRAFGGDFYFVPDIIQVQDRDSYFG